MTQTDLDPVCIVGFARTPLGAFQGTLAPVAASGLGAASIKAAVEKSGVEVEQVEQVIMGCVLSAGQGQAPARQAALGAGLQQGCAAVTVNKMCGSGMQAVIMANDIIRAGSADVIVAGGMESMSNAPYLLPKARQGMRMGDGRVLDSMMYDGLTDAYEGGGPGQVSMGIFADRIAGEYQLSRQAQDDYAITSVRRAQAAQSSGAFEQEIISVKVQHRKAQTLVEMDEGPQKAQIDKITRLRPAFRENGTVTAANASSINDGAAALVLMRRSQAQAMGHKIWAEIVSHAVHAHAPAYFTTAPVEAMKKTLSQAGWQAADVDLWEINEAFAVVPMIAMQALGLEHERVNVHGGACVLGHPIGASGGRILATLLAAMHRYDHETGAAALCIGGGEAIAICVRRV